MNNCPKCGGTTGFSYNLLMKTNRSGSWGDTDDEETDVERVYDVKTVVCDDCGKRVDFDLAHGKAVEQSVHPTDGMRPRKSSSKKVIEARKKVLAAIGG